ncbi:hypothetical protein KSP40_PGU010216 [Platanthera guangdongensis]|uniref:Uncharacterized protein n=1 Tax=Platanthera guangdongensis TaxID=2320717 RepID=A0ABR2MFZ7_9ASPA
MSARKPLHVNFWNVILERANAIHRAVLCRCFRALFSVCSLRGIPTLEDLLLIRCWLAVYLSFSHPGSAYTQYTWHLPRDYTKYSVFIPEDEIRRKNVSIEERLKMIPQDVVKAMREEVISLIPRIVYADPRSKMETLKDAFDVAVQAVITKVSKLRRDIVEGTEDKDFVEENSWKYDLLEEGKRTVGAHEWDPFFSKPKDSNIDLGSSSAEAAKSSWKNEQRNQS